MEANALLSPLLLNNMYGCTVDEYLMHHTIKLIHGLFSISGKYLTLLISCCPFLNEIPCSFWKHMNLEKQDFDDKLCEQRYHKRRSVKLWPLLVLSVHP